MPTPHGLNRRISVLIGMGAIGALLAGGALAAQPSSPTTVAEDARMSPEAALKILLGDAAASMARPLASLPPAASPVTALPAAGSATRVVVRRGDTVDGLLRRHLGESAFSVKFQRDALMRLNPSLFPQGHVHRLEVGATLWMPTEQILMGLLSGAKPELQAAPAHASATREEGAMKPSGADAPLVHTPSPTRSWVRYP